MDTIYLDNNATTAIDERVVEAMHDCYLSTGANPASQHRLGQSARKKLEDAREQIAEILNIQITDPSGDRLVFTSGGTESNNLALFGAIRTNSTEKILISSLEHPSVLKAAAHLQDANLSVQFINALPTGQIDLDHFRELTSEGRIQFTAVMAGNNRNGRRTTDRRNR